MKQVVVISGKGGTGKTTITSALARLVPKKVLVDADVDAANLEFVVNAKISSKEQYSDAEVAYIDPEKCTNCDLCRQNCRFDAISFDGNTYIVDEHACEGCKVCEWVCPVGAVEMRSIISGYVKRSDTPYGPLWHGELTAGRENSGKMVTYLRERAAEEAMEYGYDWLVIDGAPGVGCQVIASVTGVDAAIAVTEPTLSAMHDLERVIKLISHFKIPVAIVINKFDINESVAAQIRRWADENNVPVLSMLPFDRRITDAIVGGKSPIEIGDPGITDSISKIWDWMRSFSE